jgi:hypothetical protein
VYVVRAFLNQLKSRKTIAPEGKDPNKERRPIYILRFGIHRDDPARKVPRSEHALAVQANMLNQVTCLPHDVYRIQIRSANSAIVR